MSNKDLMSDIDKAYYGLRIGDIVDEMIQLYNKDANVIKNGKIPKANEENRNKYNSYKSTLNKIGEGIKSFSKKVIYK